MDGKSELWIAEGATDVAATVAMERMLWRAEVEQKLRHADQYPPEQLEDGTWIVPAMVVLVTPPTPRAA